MEKIEYMCSYCGARTIMAKSAGRPMPGNCPRKPKDKNGKMKPHTWTISRRIPG